MAKRRKNSKTYLDFFQEMCQIPHSSHNHQEIIPHLKNLIIQAGYQPIIDKNHNIFFTIPASKHYEKSPSVLLQAHTDMVFVSKQSTKTQKIN
jgi:dipeptidase D